MLGSSWRADVRELVVAGLARARVVDVIEVWCDVPAEVARRRDEQRWPSRHPIHGARLTDQERTGVERHAEPLALGPVIMVDTTRPVDVAGLARRVRTARS